MFNISHFVRNFSPVQGVCLLPPGGVLLYVEDVQETKTTQ
jgi:hypothetical protein